MANMVEGEKDKGERAVITWKIKCIVEINIRLLNRERTKTRNKVVLSISFFSMRSSLT